MPERPLTIAIVGMANSVHTARWIAMIREAWVRIVVIPVFPGDCRANLSTDVLIESSDDLSDLGAGGVGIFNLESLDWKEAEEIDRIIGFTREPHPAFLAGTQLATAHHVTTAIRIIEPDLVHSMEVQVAGYLTLEAKRRVGSSFPPWLLSNWGSDVMLFQRLPSHRPVLDRIFNAIDGYWSECKRDVTIARAFGYAGPAFEPIPASGGMHASRFPIPSRQPSDRKQILIKGYHGWAGRGMHILSALYLAAEELRGFEIVVNFPSPGTKEMADALRAHAGLDISIIPYVDHESAMMRLSECRMVIGLGISDGISTTLLEAMGVGTFPILANTSCACEWVEHGCDAMIVDPHDLRDLAEAIKIACKDDALVDAAAARNRLEILQRWDPVANGAAALRNYSKMLKIAGSATADQQPPFSANAGQAA